MGVIDDDGNELDVDGDVPVGAIVPMVLTVEIAELTYIRSDGTEIDVEARILTLWFGMKWTGTYWQTVRIGVT